MTQFGPSPTEGTSDSSCKWSTHSGLLLEESARMLQVCKEVFVESLSRGSFESRLSTLKDRL